MKKERLNRLIHLIHSGKTEGKIHTGTKYYTVYDTELNEIVHDLRRMAKIERAADALSALVARIDWDRVSLYEGKSEEEHNEYNEKVMEAHFSLIDALFPHAEEEKEE